MTDEYSMETVADARAFFSGDRFASDAGMTIETASVRHAVIRLPLDDRHRNAMGGLMGGVVAAMADFACAVASNFGTGTGQYVTADAHISFLNACRGKELTAEAVCVKHGGKLSFYEVSVRDDTRTKVANAAFTMCRVR